MGFGVGVGVGVPPPPLPPTHHHHLTRLNPNPNPNTTRTAPHRAAPPTPTTPCRTPNPNQVYFSSKSVTGLVGGEGGSPASNYVRLETVLTTDAKGPSNTGADGNPTIQEQPTAGGGGGYSYPKRSLAMIEAIDDDGGEYSRGWMRGRMRGWVRVGFSLSPPPPHTP